MLLNDHLEAHEFTPIPFSPIKSEDIPRLQAKRDSRDLIRSGVDTSPIIEKDASIQKEWIMIRDSYLEYKEAVKTKKRKFESTPENKRGNDLSDASAEEDEDF